MNTTVLYLGKEFTDSELCKKLSDQINTIHYKFTYDWHKRFKDIEFKQLVLERGIHQEDKNSTIKMTFSTFDEAVIQLIKDALYDIGSIFELDKIPMSLIKEFYEYDIDGGTLYLQSGGIKVENLMQIPGIEKKIYNYKLIKNRYEKLQNKVIMLQGKNFLLTFNLIRIILHNDSIKDVELKAQTTKFYSCYEKYMDIKRRVINC